MRSWFFLSSLVLALVGCSSDPDGRTAQTAHGLYTVRYVPAPQPIPFAELFALDVTVEDAHGDPVGGATLALKATMPAHGHGMQTVPSVSEQGDGHYRVDGMKFHMHGVWKLEFTVTAAAGEDTATFDEAYEP